jgi:large subunit ribosomal protein L4
MPKKALKSALDSAILAKLLDGEVIIADCRAGDAPKTKPVAEYFSRIGLDRKTTCLYVTPELDRILHRSARNIHGLEVRPLGEINAYCVVKPARVIFSREAFEKLVEGRK